jgi:peptidoglycan-associated lipoprotein
MPLRRIDRLLPLALGGLLLAACARKPAPAAAAREPEAPRLAEPAPAPATPGPDDRRERMLARAREAFQTLYFPYDQAVLDEKAKAVLQQVRAFLAEYPEVSVKLEGHADERGTTEYNLALGEKRARIAAAYLIDLGAPKSSLGTVSYGEEKPAREGHSEAEWGLNRRVEFAPTL